MAAIEKIRRRSGLLVAIIGIALLVFVLEDFIQSRGRSSSPVAGAVNGEEFSVYDFNKKKEKNIKNAEQWKKYNTNDPKANLTAAERYSIYNSTFEEMVKDIVMNKEYKSAGFDITSDELYDQMTGVTTGKPNQMMTQIFPDGQGGVDKAQVDQFVQNLSSYPDETQQWWLDREEELKESRLANKFDNLVKASYFLPSALAQKHYEKDNTKVSANIIAVRYASIPDSLVKITDADNKAYYNEHKADFETDEMRSIEYVIFDVVPSDDDIQNALDKIRALKDGFAKADDVNKYLVAQNSATKYDSTWLGRKQVLVDIEPAIFDNGNGVGFVTEVYKDNDAFKMARIMDMQNRPDSLKASHILIPFNAQDTTSKKDAEAKANALLAQLKNNPKNTELFAELAKENSSDGSKDNGGDLGWFLDGQMVPKFNEFVVKNPVGTLGVVETEFGFHVIKVTDKTAPQPKVRLAYMTTNITPGPVTHQQVFQKVTEFKDNNKTYEAFNKAVEEQGLTKRTMQKMEKKTYSIPGIDDVDVSRRIVLWAFNEAKKGEVASENFEFNNKMVVPVLTGVIEEGYAPLEVIAEQDKNKIINKKKGELVVEKMKACGNDVNRMMSELHAEQTTIPNISFSSNNLGNFGMEESVIGTILGMKEGEEVGPIAGNTCAFIIKKVEIQPAEATNDYSSVIMQKTSQSTQVSNLYRLLSKQAKIKDNRTDLF